MCSYENSENNVEYKIIKLNGKHLNELITYTNNDESYDKKLISSE